MGACCAQRDFPKDKHERNLKQQRIIEANILIQRRQNKAPTSSPKKLSHEEIMRSTKNSLQAELIPTDPVIKDISFELTSTFADLNHSWIDDTLADLNDYTEVKEFQSQFIHLPSIQSKSAQTSFEIIQQIINDELKLNLVTMCRLVDLLLSVTISGTFNSRIWASFCLYRISKKSNLIVLLSEEYLQLIQQSLLIQDYQVSVYLISTLKHVYARSQDLTAFLNNFSQGNVIQLAISQLFDISGNYYIYKQLKSIFDYIFDRKGYVISDNYLLCTQFFLYEALEQIEKVIDHSDTSPYLSKIFILKNRLLDVQLSQRNSMSRLSLRSTQQYIEHIPHMSLKELIRDLGNTKKIKSCYIHKTWALEPETRGSLCALQLSVLLQELNYPQSSYTIDYLKDLIEGGAVNKLLKGFLTDNRSMNQCSAIGLQFVLQSSPYALQMPLNNNKVFQKFVICLKDNCEEFRSCISDIISSLTIKEIKENIFQYNNGEIIEQMIKITNEFTRNQRRFDHLCNLRNMYTNDKNKQNINLAKRIDSLGLQDAITQIRKTVSVQPRTAMRDQINDLTNCVNEELTFARLSI